MQLFWFLAFGCLTVSAIPLEGEDGQKFEKATTFEEEEGPNRTNGVHGWYVPQPDGSLQWMSIEAIERIQSNNDGVLSRKRRMIANPFSTVKFWLYTQLNPEVGEDISPESVDIGKSGFNPDLLTFIIAHGFLQTKYAFSLNMLLRDALYETGPINFIYIEWADAKTFNYIRSSNRVSAVGKLTANLFDRLVQKYKMNCEKTHLIGHSLGAHVVGFAAKNIKSCKVPRITALDPALPLFPYNQPAQRLNSTDARYVESIQTDGGSFGHVEPIGTASFYCNGGKRQPGCRLVMYNVCCHERSVHYFREAVVHKNFPANKCDDYRSAIAQSCQKSEVRMADERNNLVARGTYSVKTNRKSPYGTPWL